MAGIPHGRAGAGPEDAEACAAQEREESRDKMCNDMLRLGGLEGLRYFRLRLQRREELLVRVLPGRGHTLCSGPGRVLHVADGGRAPSSPASSPAADAPTEVSVEEGEEGVAYLVAAYEAYERPLAWSRTQRADDEFAEAHVEGMSGDATPSVQRDLPLVLPSLEDWAQQPLSIDLVHVLADLAFLSLRPPPLNAFEVDFAHPALQPPPKTLWAADTEESFGSVREHLSAVAALISLLSSIAYEGPIAGDLKRYGGVDFYPFCAAALPSLRFHHRHPHQQTTQAVRVCPCASREDGIFDAHVLVGVKTEGEAKTKQTRTAHQPKTFGCFSCLTPLSIIMRFSTRRPTIERLPNTNKHPQAETCGL